jgi:hypothetical protein
MPTWIASRKAIVWDARRLFLQPVEDESGGRSLMRPWLKRIRGTIGMGLTWATGWDVLLGSVRTSCWR